jgi:hypothetical protein
MTHGVNGIERPKEKDFANHSREIRNYTKRFLGSDVDSENSFKILQKVLYSANTLLNYYEQYTMGGGSKNGRGSVGTPDVSDSKCTPCNLYSELTSSR